MAASFDLFLELNEHAGGILCSSALRSKTARRDFTSSSVDLENKIWQITQWHDPTWNCGRYNCNFCGNIEGRKEFEQKLKTETIEELKMIRDMLVTNMMISETTAFWDSWDELEEVENKKIGF